MKRIETVWNLPRRGLLLLTLGSALLSTGCRDKQLATVPNDSQANQIINVLRENKIDAVKEEVLVGQKKQYQIAVHGDIFGDDNDYFAASQILEDNCLPLVDPPEIDSTPIFDSSEAEQAKIHRQLKIDIVHQLRTLPGVTCVEVTFVEPPRDITIDPYPSKASVTINYKNETPSFTDQEIKDLVAGAVAKVKPEAVMVKSVYHPVRPVQRSNQSNVGRFIAIGGAGLSIILGSVFLVYYLRKRRGDSTALAVQSGDFEEIETIDSQ